MQLLAELLGVLGVLAVLVGESGIFADEHFALRTRRAAIVLAVVAMRCAQPACNTDARFSSVYLSVCRSLCAKSDTFGRTRVVYINWPCTRWPSVSRRAAAAAGEFGDHCDSSRRHNERTRERNASSRERCTDEHNNLAFRTRGHTDDDTRVAGHGKGQVNRVVSECRRTSDARARAKTNEKTRP